MTASVFCRPRDLGEKEKVPGNREERENDMMELKVVTNLGIAEGLEPHTSLPDFPYGCLCSPWKGRTGQAYHV